MHHLALDPPGPGVPGGQRLCPAWIGKALRLSEANLIGAFGSEGYFHTAVGLTMESDRSD